MSLVLEQRAANDFRVSSERIAAALGQHWDGAPTPARRFLPNIAEEIFADARAALHACSPLYEICYSVKTNPRDEMVALARKYGCLAECISELEWEQARRQGFEPHEITYNGPLTLRNRRVRVAFADSVEQFEEYARNGLMDLHGVRVRPHNFPSRFGVPTAELPLVAQAARVSERVEELGVSFFVRPEDCAKRKWRHIADEVLGHAVELERASGRPIRIFNIGAGFFPQKFARLMEQEYPAFAQRAAAALPALQEIYFEPGQELATAVEAIVVRVVEVRRRAWGTDVIIDSGLPSLPEITRCWHRVFLFEESGWHELPMGHDRLLGCICMEEDIVRTDLDFPDTLRAGDILAIADAGAYDSSMAFDFAKGRGRPIEP